MIKPTVGRVVWFRPKGANLAAQPLAGIVAYVHNDRCVNLTVSDEFGNTSGVVSVPLMQEGDPARPDGFYAEWMPFQKGQAAKTEQLEQRAQK